MRYLVTGASGLVGYYLCGRLSSLEHTIIPATHLHRAGLQGEIQFDICDVKSVQKAMHEAAPDIVVHCAAMTNIDQCEQQSDLAEKINASGTENICNAANEIGAKFVFMSTSFVFGSQSGPLAEDSRPSPINSYGASKLRAESYVQAHSRGFLILRIDQPFYKPQAWQKADMVSRILSQLKRGEQFEVVFDWFNQPTYLPDLYLAMDALIREDQHGIFHCTGQERISRFDWAKLIAKVYGFDADLIKPVLSSKLNLPALRPDMVLSCSKLSKATGLSSTPLERALAELKNLG